MDTNAKFSRMLSLYKGGVILGSELSFHVLDAVLEGEISTFEECKECILPEMREYILGQIQAFEENDYVDPNPFINDGLSIEDRKERARRLRPVCEKVFGQIKEYLGEIEPDTSR